MAAQLALVQRESFEIVPGCLVIPELLSPRIQAETIARLREHRTGWDHPGMPDGTPFSVKILCFGLEWSFKGYQPAKREIPEWLVSLAMRSGEAFDFLPKYSDFEIQTAIVNFYSETARLGLHIDQQENWKLRQAGSPIINLSLGCDGEFQIRESGQEFEDGKGRLHTVILQSGDCVIMHGAARNFYHGIKRIFPGTSPIPGFHVGRLSITFRQVNPI